mgnify:CR=1 FL=1
MALYVVEEFRRTAPHAPSREIAEAVEHQLKTLDAYSIFGDFANEPALRPGSNLHRRRGLVTSNERLILTPNA